MIKNVILFIECLLDKSEKTCYNNNRVKGNALNHNLFKKEILFMAYYVKNLNDYCEKCVAENVSMFQGSERWGLLVNSPAGTVMIVDTERGLSWAAHCHEDDEFDFNIGFTYAYHRMKGWDLPEEKKKPKVRIGKLGTLDTFVYCGHKFRFLGYTKDGNFVNAEMIGYEGKYATFSVGTEVEKV